MKIEVFVDGTSVIERDISPYDSYPGVTASGFFNLGILGEWVVQQKLLFLGIDYIIPTYSSPYDIILTQARKFIEVKTAQQGFTKVGAYRTASYAFNLKSKRADYLILWAVDINTFYIMSTNQLCIGVNRVYPNAKRWKQAENNWQRLQS